MDHGDRSPLDEAMRRVDRRRFLPQCDRHRADINSPISIGHGATNSQPTTVRTMLELLEVRLGHKVLDVGAGSGWTTALLSHLVGSTGEVIGVELEPSLVEFGAANLLRCGYSAVIHQAAPGALGWAERAPYDRILVSAMANHVPQDLLDQLAPDGIMVIPVRGDMLRVRRTQTGTMISRHGRYLFVPLR